MRRRLPSLVYLAPQDRPYGRHVTLAAIVGSALGLSALAAARFLARQATARSGGMDAEAIAAARRINQRLQQQQES